MVNLDIQPSIAILLFVLWTAASVWDLIYQENERKIVALIIYKNLLKPDNASCCVLLYFFFKSLKWLTWWSAEILPKWRKWHLVLTDIFFKVYIFSMEMEVCLFHFLTHQLSE